MVFDVIIGRSRKDVEKYGREGSFGDAIIVPSQPLFCLGQRTMLFRPDKIKCNSQFLQTIPPEVN